jgi:hypothetical protein
MSLTTTVDAVCKYDEDDIAYDAMNGNFLTDAHPWRVHVAHVQLTGNTGSVEKTYYVRCKNKQTGAVNTESEKIWFTVIFTTAANNAMLNQMASAVGNFLVPSAMAVETTAGDTTTGSSQGSLFDPNSGDDFVEEGYTKEGTGTEAFHSRLEKLKPGTFYYARAYVVVNGKTTYGNQVGFRTGDSCFVATAAFGSIFHPYVRILRDFRDSYLLDNQLGRTLVSLYYKYSPPVADVIAADSGLRLAVRILLLPIVGLAWLLMQLGVPGLLLVGVAAAAGIYALRPASGCLRT